MYILKQKIVSTVQCALCIYGFFKNLNQTS